MSPGIGVGIGLPFVHLQRRGGFSPASLFSSGEEGAWYDPSDLSTLWQDAAGTTPVTAADQPVGRIDDKSGNGNHATQGTAGSRPLYKTAGGLHWLEGDGVDDSLRHTYGAGLNYADFSVATAIERVGAGTGVDVNQITGWGLGTALKIGFTHNATPKTYYHVTDISNPNNQSVLSDATAAKSVCVGNFGSAGYFEANGVAKAVASAGIVRDPDSICLFTTRAGAGDFSNRRNFGMIALNRNLTTAEIAALRTYLAEKSGVTL